MVKQFESLAGRSAVEGKGSVESTNRTQQGFADQYGANPRSEYMGKGTTTKDVYSGGQLLNTYGADIPEDTVYGEDADYPYNYSFHTPAGHIIEYNDTSGSERIMIRHKDGMGINIGPDGSILVSGQRRIEVVNENYYLNVGGSGLMKFEGNLDIEVTGNMNVKVGGEYNITSTKSNQTTNGPSFITTYGDQASTVVGNRSDFTTGGHSLTALKGKSDIVKGDYKLGVEGDMTIAGSTTLTMTAENEVVITSQEANIGAQNLSVFGETGTFGGDTVTMYYQNAFAKSATYTDGVTAPCFHGDLEGLAQEASESYHQNYPDGSASPSTYTASVGASNWVADGIKTATDTTETARPVAQLMSDYINKGSKGTKKVKIDPEDTVLHNVDRTNKSGGVTNRPLTNREVRARMREPNNRDNKEFVTQNMAEGKLNPEFSKTAPPNVNRVKNIEETVVQGSTRIGSVDVNQTAKRIKGVR